MFVFGMLLLKACWLNGYSSAEQQGFQDIWAGLSQPWEDGQARGHRVYNHICWSCLQSQTLIGRSYSMEMLQKMLFLPLTSSAATRLLVVAMTQHPALSAGPRTHPHWLATLSPLFVLKIKVSNAKWKKRGKWFCKTVTFFLWFEICELPHMLQTPSTGKGNVSDLQ